MEVKRGALVDGSPCRMTHWEVNVNDARGTGTRPNVRFTKYGGIVTTRGIRRGEELLVRYGRTYWRGKGASK